VAQVQESCASPVNPTIRVTPIERDGTVGDPILRPSPSRLGLCTAYDGANELVVFYSSTTGGYTDLRARTVDTTSLVEGAEELVISGRSVDQVEVGYDGTQYGIVYGIYDPLGTRWTTSFRTWSPGSPPSAPITLFASSDRRFAQGRVIGTEDGWALAMTTVESSGTGLAPGVDDAPQVWLYRLAPSGSVREALQIDADQRAALLPDLVWAGDRLALTWARQDIARNAFHMLSYVGCE
jgi:hypothetical protein